MSPRPNIYCKQNISDLSVCDSEQKEMAVDENYCLSVDWKGLPVDIYSKFSRLNLILIISIETISKQKMYGKENSWSFQEWNLLFLK